MNSEMAPCPKCRQMNATISVDCLFCGAPLPWAAQADALQPNAVPGAPAPIAEPSGQEQPVSQKRRYRDYSDKEELWIAVVSCLVPVIGLTLYIHYHGSSPLRARSAVKGLLAWLGIILLVFGLAQLR